MYATAAESRERVTDFYRRVWVHSDTTIQETARHAGHADIIREAIDGAAGLREGVSNMPPEADANALKAHYAKLESIARSA